jgi:outer membrane protein assembly factor BamB
MTGRSTLRLTGATTLLVCALAGCSEGPQIPRLGDLNPFAEKETPLPGKRIPVALAESKAGLQVAAAEKPIAIPAARVNDSWTQPGGTPSNSPGHLALGGTVRRAWSADAGQGSSSYGRLTASPIVSDGRVLVLDSQGRVSAFTLSGASAWRASLVPDKEKAYKGFGGGLAAEQGRVFAATGFGWVYALDITSGKKLWEKNLNTPIRTSPTVANGRVIVVTSEGSARALAATDGQELWTHQGLPEKAAILNNSSPAVEGDIVVVPYPSGELVALRLSDGQPAWSESLARTRLASSLGSMTDAGRPVIDSGTVFAVGHSGRMVATNARSGERLWSLNVPGIQAPAIAGEMIYVVDTGGQLMAVTRRDGRVLWTVKLPNASTWSGPVLAGNKLWLASNKGQLIGVDATTGKPDTPQDVGAPVYIAPVVAGSRLYILTDKASLIAFQ